MTTCNRLLHSSIRLLLRDQQGTAAAFKAWNSTDTVERHESIGPLIGSTHRRLRRDRDRIFMLLQSYHDLDCAADTVTKVPEIGSAVDPVATGRGEGSSDGFKLVDIPRQAYRALETLSTRYSSVYFAASVVGEPPIANVARSNRKGIRELMSALDRIMPLDAPRSEMDHHPASSPKDGLSWSSLTPDSK
jgi:hypothetical protein